MAEMIITAAVVAALCVMGAVLYRMGLRDGLRMGQGSSIDPLLKKPGRAPKISQEQQRILELRQKVDDYNGGRKKAGESK